MSTQRVIEQKRNVVTAIPGPLSQERLDRKKARRLRQQLAAAVSA